MPNLQVILKRRRAIRNIHAVTRTMEMIGTAQYQRVSGQRKLGMLAIEQAMRMLGEAATIAARSSHPLLVGRADRPCGLVVLASDRGMCGGYNNRLGAVARKAAAELLGEGRKIRIYIVGKRGRFQMLPERRRAGREDGVELPPPHQTHLSFDGRDLYAHVVDLAEQLMQEFTRGELGEARVVFTRHLRPGASAPEVIRLLPVELPPPADHRVPPDLMPSTGQVVEALLPMAVRLRLYECFLDAIASEHMARMIAMRMADGNAEEMLADLAMRINRARRGKITTELAEILGGSEAVQ